MGFRAFVVDNQGDRIGTEVTELADEELGDEPVLIDVAWSALNFKDTMVVQPNNRVARPWDRITCTFISNWACI